MFFWPSSLPDDFHGDWRALLDCGHYQHVRHNPPLISREWFLSDAARNEKIGRYSESSAAYGERFLWKLLPMFVRTNRLVCAFSSDHPAR